MFIYLDMIVQAPMQQYSALVGPCQSMPHQKATTADGQTVLERAVLQHNVLAASRVYKNMRLNELGCHV